MPRLHPVLAAAALLGGIPLAIAQPGATCSARSGPTITPVVELYTSEGCSSCPPADRWLSTLKADRSVVALAFHVNYWDRLGWRDRFSTPAFTQRQAEQQAVNGSRYSYTPQVVMQGRDERNWSGRGVPAGSGRSAVDLILSGDGTTFSATVQSRNGAPARLAAYWAVTEDGHRSHVTAGENSGERLVHDYVVREIVTVPAWAGASTTLQFNSAGSIDAAHPRAVSLVVTDAATGKPVQAVRLPC